MTHKNKSNIFPNQRKTMGNNRNIWLFGCNKPILKDKDALIGSYIQYMQSRTLQMFEYTGLPETIPQREFELILQMCRFAIVTKKDGKLFVFFGGLGGQPNEYYQPTQAIVTNPYLKFSEVLKLDDYIKDDANAVVVWNDMSHVGLYPMFRKNAEMLAECDISIRYKLINKRFMNILTADDDNTKTSIEKMFEDVENGDGFGIVVTKTFLEDSSVGVVKASEHQDSDLKDIIECKQYYLASWFNELGLNANFNMKRESINESEADMNEDALLPLIDSMLKTRQIGVDAINKLFGTNISVDLNSSWKKIREEIEQREEVQQAEIDAIKNQGDKEEPEDSEKGDENETSKDE